MSDFPQEDLAIDATGLVCPLPLLRTKKALQGLESSQVLKVATTDKSAVSDFKAFAKQTGHEILLQVLIDDKTTWHFIKKR
ncbi:sirA-like family protein [Pelistega indica]|uniref:SirA-like family protein n=1 Tax=Pelistega indica TaxID=1414851 RepID=V8G921_9BURK|nr:MULTISPECIES: sulfurtransferase TusA family protein [Pelistega]ETD73004.1 sirA-like family protein [Pelistega indica]